MAGRSLEKAGVKNDEVTSGTPEQGFGGKGNMGEKQGKEDIEFEKRVGTPNS